MPRIRAFVVATLVTSLFAAGAVSAADRSVSPRQPARGDLKVQSQVQPAGPASALQVLRLRLLDTIRLVKALQRVDTADRTGVYGLDGLSDGPDPIDNANQATQLPGDPHVAGDDVPDATPPDGEPADPFVNFCVQ